MCFMLKTSWEYLSGAFVIDIERKERAIDGEVIWDVRTG